MLFQALNHQIYLHHKDNRFLCMDCGYKEFFIYSFIFIIVLLLLMKILSVLIQSFFMISFFLI
jgi:hypothetical protein